MFRVHVSSIGLLIVCVWSLASSLLGELREAEILVPVLVQNLGPPALCPPQSCTAALLLWELWWRYLGWARNLVGQWLIPL